MIEIKDISRSRFSGRNRRNRYPQGAKKFREPEVYLVKEKRSGWEVKGIQ